MTDLFAKLRRYGKRRRAPVCSLKERVQSPSQGFGGFRKSPAASVKKPILALRQKIFRPPAPFVTVLAQGFVIFRQASDQGLHSLKFSLDGAHARE